MRPEAAGREFLPDRRFMEAALALAEEAYAAGEIPVGAVVVKDGAVIGRGRNRREASRSVLGHAELEAMEQAAASLGDWRLSGCTLYVTLEPCPMCAGAISFARIRRLYYAAADPKGGGVEHGPRVFNQPTCHHAPEVYSGFREGEAAGLLRDFFAGRRGRDDAS